MPPRQARPRQARRQKPRGAQTGCCGRKNGLRGRSRISIEGGRETSVVTPLARREVQGEVPLTRRGGGRAVLALPTCVGRPRTGLPWRSAAGATCGSGCGRRTARAARAQRAALFFEQTQEVIHGRTPVLGIADPASFGGGFAHGLAPQGSGASIETPALRACRPRGSSLGVFMMRSPSGPGVALVSATAFWAEALSKMLWRNSSRAPRVSS